MVLKSREELKKLTKDFYSAKYYKLDELQESKNDSNFSPPDATYTPSSSYWSISGKTNGTYYYRVRAHNTAGYSDWSDDIRYITVDIDTIAPTNPTSCNAWETSSQSIVISNNTWQKTTANPYFVWTGASDDKSGISGYSVYFGLSSSGEPGTSQEQSNNSYDAGADPGSNGTYYLRVRTFDNVGNYSSAITLFTVKYDGSSPNNPTSCSGWKTSSKVVSISSGIWQTETANPYFEWATVTDLPSGVEGIDNSGVKCFYIYFGNNPNGDPTISVDKNNPKYDAGADPGTPGTYYFRIKTEDNVNNPSTVITLFVVKYDGAPNITDIAAKTESVGIAITENTWQTDRDPYFFWPEPASASVIEGYSWAGDTLPDDTVDNPPGTDTFYQCSNNSVATGKHKFYVKAKNNIGWGNADSFEIWVDTTPPTVPVVTDDGDYANSTSQLHATWTSSEDVEDISKINYEYAIGTAPYYTNTKDWTYAGNATEITVSQLSLNNFSYTEETYYFSVRAANEAGLTSEIGVGDGIKVDALPPQISNFSTPQWLEVTSNLFANFSMDITVQEDLNIQTNVVVLNWEIRDINDNLKDGPYSKTLSGDASSGTIHYTGTVDFTNSELLNIQASDKIEIWVTGSDIAGNSFSTIGNKQGESLRTINIITTKKNVGTSPDQISVSDKVSVTIPENTFTSTTTVIIGEVSKNLFLPLTDTEIIGSGWQVDADKNLNKPITLTIRFSKNQIPMGVGKDKLAIYKNGTDKLVTSIDTSNNTTSATITEYGKYVILAPVKAEYQNIIMYNYPNPASLGQDITFKYEISENPNDLVKIKIYNLAGDLVRVFDNLLTSTGLYSIDWNGVNKDGGKINPGIYVYALEINGKVVKKQILHVSR